jgi:hypothetical protein
MKAHIANNHAGEIAKALFEYEGAVHGTAFLSEIHRISKVLDGLKGLGYQPVPACQYLTQR